VVSKSQDTVLRKALHHLRLQDDDYGGYLLPALSKPWGWNRRGWRQNTTSVTSVNHKRLTSKSPLLLQRPEIWLHEKINNYHLSRFKTADYNFNSPRN
jgi:hypothetical protein